SSEGALLWTIRTPALSRLTALGAELPGSEHAARQIAGIGTSAAMRHPPRRRREDVQPARAVT
ncbi:MAG TPA: hypothetical protein VFZ18_04180, partial [Longimicrobiaceae bacterium]